MWLQKQHYTPLKRKKRVNNIHALSQKKREEEEGGGV